MAVSRQTAAVAKKLCAQRSMAIINLNTKRNSRLDLTSRALITRANAQEKDT